MRRGIGVDLIAITHSNRKGSTMSRLYGSMDADASKTTATRRAYKEIDAHVRGRNNGVKVCAYVDANDHEVFQVYQTGGSNATTSDVLLLTLVDGFEVE